MITIDPQLILVGLFLCMILMALIMIAVVSSLRQVAAALQALRKSFDDFRTKVLAEYVHRDEFTESVAKLRAEIEATK